MPESWMLTRRRFVLGTTAMAATGLLAACGGDDDDDANDEDSSGNTPAASGGSGTGAGAESTTAAGDGEATSATDEGEGESDGDSTAAAGDAGSTPGMSAPNQNTNIEEWTVVTSHQTGGADPLSEYPSNSVYYLPWHVTEPLFYPALADDGTSWTLVNELAKGWEFTDPQTLVVTLEEGIMFQNGEELTAEHVKQAYDFIINSDPPIRRAAPLRPLGEAEVIDDYTITWHLPEPNFSVLGAMYMLLIPPLARYEMTAEEFEANPSGTGPYMVKSWPRDGIIELEAWDGYRRGKVAPNRIVGRNVPDASTRLFELISGNAQIAHGLTTDAMSELDGNDKYELVGLQGAILQADPLNLYKTNPNLRDKRVRQAINYAIDRFAIVDAVIQRGTVMPGPLAPGWLGFNQEHVPYPYDPEMAKSLLQEAGVSNLTFDWKVSSTSAKHIEVIQAAAAQLQEVGITANIVQAETARTLADRSEGNYDAVALGFGTTWMPSTLFQFTLNVSLPDDKLQPQWGDTPPELARVRELYAQANQSTTIEQFEQGLREVHDLMHDEAFWIYIYSIDELWGVQKDTGYRPFPTVYLRWYDEWGRRGLVAPTEPSVPLVF